MAAYFLKNQIKNNIDMIKPSHYYLDGETFRVVNEALC